MEKRYFVIDLKKYAGAEAYKNIIGHNMRNRNYKNRGNIDTQKSQENIILTEPEHQRWEDYMAECNALIEKKNAELKRIKKEIKEKGLKEEIKEKYRKKLRHGKSDFFSIVVDSSVIPDWKTEDYIEYLKEAEKWLRERFAGQKILASVIHMDEKKPHLHLTISYFNDDDARWSQKRLAQNKATDLDTLLKEFEEEIGKKYGLSRGESIENKGRKAVSNAVKIREEKKGILWWKRTEYKVTGVNKKQYTRIGRALVFAKEYEKHKPDIQHTARVSELNRKIEELAKESLILRQELSQAREKLLSQEKEIQELRKENQEYRSLVKLAGSPEKLQSLVHRSITDKIRSAGKLSDPDSPKK